MSSVEYPGTYTDSRGVESIVIRNDGHTRATRVRGVDFTSTDFDSLEPAPEQAALASTLFVLNHGCLCDCVLSFRMSVIVAIYGQRSEAGLHVRLELGGPAPNGGITSEVLKLTLERPYGRVESSGTRGWFEDELLEIDRALEPEEQLLTCLTCRLSDYHPVGNGLFGQLACFRDARATYLAASSKSQVMAIWDRHTEYVQETHLCDRWEPRPPGTGYRG